MQRKYVYLSSGPRTEPRETQKNRNLASDQASSILTVCLRPVKYSYDHERRAAIDPSVAIALVPGVSQAAIAVAKTEISVDKSCDG